MEVEYEILSHKKILERANKDNDGGNNLDQSIENNSESDHDDSSLPDEKVFMWEIKQPALDPLPTPPFDLPEQKTDKDPAQPSTLDDNENGEQNEQKCWYIECLAREMGHIIESANNDILSTHSDNKELVSDESAEVNDVQQVSWNKWPPLPEIDRCIANLHDPPLDGNCLFNSFINFFCGLENVDNYKMTCSALREKAMCHLLDHRDHRTHSHTFEELLDWQLPDVRAHERDKRKNPTQEQRKLFGKMPKLSLIEDYAETMRDDTPHKCIWGSILEIYVISNLYSLNVALYLDNTGDGNTFT